MYPSCLTLLLLWAVSMQQSAEGKKCTDPQTTEEETYVTFPWTTPVPTTEEPLEPPPENWPKGKYSMLIGGTLCPRYETSTKPKFRWRSGYRYHDTEDYRNGNSWPTEVTALDQMMKSDGIKMIFCTKNTNKQLYPKRNKQYNFAPGNYCVHRFGKPCPTPQSAWTVGRMVFDDEDRNNANARWKTLPSGLYNQNVTAYDFCCREDGDVNTPIMLPATTPFYMYRYTGEKCQKVGWMNEREDIVQFDDEDTNNKNTKDSTGVPYNTGDPANHRLHLCHYEPTDYADNMEDTLNPVSDLFN